MDGPADGAGLPRGTAPRFRILAGIDLRRVSTWLSVAALAFLGALAAWGAVVGPTLGAARLAPRPRPDLMDEARPPAR